MTRPLTCPVAARVRDTALRHGDRTAVVGSGRRVSYAQLVEDAEGWRDRCLEDDLPTGSVVVVVAGGEPDLAAVFLGVREAGLVPLLVDSGLPERRVAELAEVVRPSGVIRLSEGRLERTAGATQLLPPDAGYVVFSSGSQGAPKAIVGQAAGLVHFVEWEVETLGVAPGTRTAMLTSPSFDVVFRDLLVPLFAGGELHVAPGRVRSTPAAVPAWLAESAVELVHVVPSLGARWIADSAVRMPDLRWTLFAGEPLKDHHVEAWRAAAPNTEVFNLYGPSETTLAKFWHRVPQIARPGLQAVGRPLPGTSVRLDEVAGARSITISTTHGSLGYLAGTGSPDDHERLQRVDGVTTFRTQDRGRLTEEGDLVVLGRLDSLVKRNGRFVDLAGIEAAATDLDEVRAACCAHVESTGHVVLVVDGPVVAADPMALRRRLRPRLGTELPDRIVGVPALPLLPSGKVDRQRVRAMLS